jgi:hypothetical protein
MRHRRLASATVALVMALVGVIAAAAPAQAAGCALSIGYTVNQFQYIQGSGWLTNCAGNQSARLTVQRHRWSGWEDVGTSVLVPNDGYRHYIWYDSNVITTTCPS